MEVGNILIAISPCKMNGGEKCALTVEREYPIQDVSSDKLWIINNQGDKHWYGFEGKNDYRKWFRPYNVEEEIY